MKNSYAYVWIWLCSLAVRVKKAFPVVVILRVSVMNTQAAVAFEQPEAYLPGRLRNANKIGHCFSLPAIHQEQDNRCRVLLNMPYPLETIVIPE